MEGHIKLPCKLERTDSNSSMGAQSPKPLLKKKFNFATIAKQALEKKKTNDR